MYFCMTSLHFLKIMNFVGFIYIEFCFAVLRVFFFLCFYLFLFTITIVIGMFIITDIIFIFFASDFCFDFLSDYSRLLCISAQSPGIG